MPEPKKNDETMRRLMAAAEVAKKHMAPKPKEVSDDELARRESRAVLRYWKDQDEAIRESEFDADEPMSDFDMAFWSELHSVEPPYTLPLLPKLFILIACLGFRTQLDFPVFSLIRLCPAVLCFRGCFPGGRCITV